MPHETYDEFKKRMQNSPNNVDMYCKKCDKVYPNHRPSGVCVDCLSKLVPYNGLPECPTCHSKNIESVSQTRRSLNRWAFGINNPTARAQFECKNCGYKW